MNALQTNLREKLKKEKFVINDKEEQVILLLLRHRYGLYTAEVARALDLMEANARVLLCALKKKNVLECKEVQSLDSLNIAQGYKLHIPDRFKVMSSRNEEVSFEKGLMAKTSKTDVVIDEEGFRIPFQRRSGNRKSVIFKIKKELLQILSQK